MPRHPSHILELAKRGAEARIQELQAEIKSLTQIFPHLRYGAAVSPAMPDTVEDGKSRGRRRRRSKMSAAARKAVSDRMKKYWAKRKSAKKSRRRPVR